MKVSESMCNKICMLETGKKFGTTLTSRELNGIYVAGDSKKVGHHKTYGYGLLYYPDGKRFMDQVKSTYSQKEIESLYMETINQKVKKVEVSLKKAVNQDQIDALVCIAYNFGSVPSSLLSKVNANPNDKSIYNLWVHLSDAQYKRMGNKVKGLLARRKMEADWYFGKH